MVLRGLSEWLNDNRTDDLREDSKEHVMKGRNLERFKLRDKIREI